MPELPEVETTVRGLLPHLRNQMIDHVDIRCPRLRWPIPKALTQTLKGQRILNIKRRAKYILFEFAHGTLLLHLGMSGRVRVLKRASDPNKHDHVDLCLTNGSTMRFTDPRRFGALLYTTAPVADHPLLAKLGPEPLSRAFTGKYLWERAQKKQVAVKSFVMNGHIVVGVGNIYATEALFIAGIHPRTAAGDVSREQYDCLVVAIKRVLRQAITKGGTTLKDFSRSDGSPGYFSLKLKVYGRAHQPCTHCGTTLESIRIGQRSSVFCPTCQRPSSRRL